MEKQLENSLRLAINFLNTHELQYAIIGGIALAQWGVVRATHDIDFKVLVPDTNYSAVRAKILAAFPEQGRPQVPQNPLITSVKVSGVIVDFLLALPTAEDPIIQKSIAGRGNRTNWM